MIKDNGVTDVTSIDSIITVSVVGGVAKPRPSKEVKNSNLDSSLDNKDNKSIVDKPRKA